MPALAVLLLACSEATAPASGTFRAQIQGATVATLTGASNAGPIYTEDSPEGSYVIGMFTPRGDTVISISIRCPNNEPLPPGTYAIDTSASTCHGGYSRLVSDPESGGLTVIEHVSASSGSMRIDMSGADQTEGRFGFDGTLVVGSDPVGSVHLSGAFSALNR